MFRSYTQNCLFCVSACPIYMSHMVCQQGDNEPGIPVSPPFLFQKPKIKPKIHLEWDRCWWVLNKFRSQVARNPPTSMPDWALYVQNNAQYNCALDKARVRAFWVSLDCHTRCQLLVLPSNRLSCIYLWTEYVNRRHYNTNSMFFIVYPHFHIRRTQPSPFTPHIRHKR